VVRWVLRVSTTSRHCDFTRDENGALARCFGPYSPVAPRPGPRSSRFGCSAVRHVLLEKRMKLMMRGTALAFVALVLAAGCSGRAVSDEAGSDEDEEPSTNDDESGEVTESDAGASTDQELTDNTPGASDDGC